jgi:DNA-binding transcriptional LysR family regulator
MSEIHRKPISRQVDLNLLDLFDTVFRTRNLTNAGTILGLSQPAMSHALARLREMYGDPLFVRLPQGLRPTPFAEQLAGPVAAALHIVRDTLEKARFDPATAQRTFRIAMTDIGEQVFLPTLIKFLWTHAPGIKIETKVTSTSAHALINDLSTGDIDLAVGFIPASKGIFQKTLFSDDYVCVVRRAHPVVRNALSLPDFMQLRHVVADVAGTGHASSVVKVLSANGMNDNIVLWVNHFLSIAPLIANTDLVATVPRNLANTFVKSWKLHAVEPPVKFPNFDITQYWHERYEHEPGNIWLRQMFETIFLEFKSEEKSPAAKSARPARQIDQPGRTS